jgi:hypothetical protein
MNNNNEIEEQFLLAIRLHAQWEEVWLPIRGRPKYEISSTGRVQNIKSKRILKPFIDGGGYHTITFNSSNDKRTKIKTHRLVAKAFLTNPDNKPMVDHIDHNRVNNNVSNLRWVTRSQNGMNTSKFCNNKSGVTGVIWCKTYNKWRAFITLYGIRKHLGYFNSLDKAKKARIAAVDKMFGSFANHQTNK